MDARPSDAIAIALRFRAPIFVDDKIIEKSPELDADYEAEVTTEEGANFQRENARGDLSDLIAQQVQQAISRNLDQPDFYPERQTIQKKADDSVLNQVSALLHDHAHKFETASVG